MKAAILAGAGATAMLIGYVGGRATAPTKTVEKTVTKTIEVQAKTKEDTSVEARTADIQTVTRWRIKYVTRPDGTVVTTASGDSGESSKTADHREEAKRETQVVYRDREIEKVVVKESGRPQWALGALIGTDPTRITRVPAGPGSFVYSGIIERRIIGPVWLGVYASTAADFGVMARVEW